MARRGHLMRDAIPQTTCEPEYPLPDWPEGHVCVELTDDSFNHECLKLTVHGVEHYLHACTARELSNQLLYRLEQHNRHLVRTLGDELGSQLTV
jgi:hypothetical protein